MHRRIRTLIAIAFAVTACLAVSAAPGAGHPVDPAKGVTSHWTCRASSGYANVVKDAQQQGHIEPVVANGDSGSGADRDTCASDGSGILQIVVPPGGSAQGQATLDAPRVQTQINPDFSYKQTANADAVLQHIKLEGSGHSLEADVTTAHATAGCKDGAPVMTAASNVSNLRIDGSPVGDKGDAGTYGDGAHFIVVVNEKLQTTDAKSGGRGLVQRALHIALASDAKNYIEFVFGEVRVGHHGTTTELCSAPPARCPEGAAYDAARGVCVITVTPPQGPCPEGATRDPNGVCVLVVGPPSAQPATGGNVVPLGDVKGYRGPCTNPRFGTQVAILGTKAPDRITGSNRSDRIFVFAGNDRVSGGRGNDCIEGGLGADALDGSNGTDWLLGGAGDDHLNGGPGDDWLYGGAGRDKLQGGGGQDRLYGGRGRNTLDGGRGNDTVYGGPQRDWINGGNGRDTIYGGAGDDVINVATAGPPAHVDCGPGDDIIRINQNEINTIANCERVLVTTRLIRYRQYNQKVDRPKPAKPKRVARAKPKTPKTAAGSRP
jgi:hypothetical protein